MKKLVLFTTQMLLIVLLTQSHAQDKWTLEFRPNVNFATENIDNSDLKQGLGFEGTIAYRFMPHLAVYSGWSWNHFSVDQSFAGSDASFEETGYFLGLQFIHPIAESSINFLLRAGGTYNHIEVENNDGDIVIDSGHGLGWQTEAGLSISMSENLKLLPSIRYRSLSRDITTENEETSLQLNYLSVGVGFSWLL